MFQSSKQRLRAWLRWTDDILGDPAEELGQTAEGARQHPHRRELRWHRERRGGTVPAAPAHCISPVRVSARQRLRTR